MSKHTPGPWQVVVDEHPHKFGGVHTERRIFTAWDHPQMKGPIGVVNMSVGVGAKEGDKAIKFVAIEEADARLIAAAPDLLEACKAALTDDQPYIEKCRAALAKATGEQT